MHFIFMLTHHDATIPNAREVYRSIADLDLQHLGFKDVGVPADELARLAEDMHRDGKTVMLEVVSERREDELRSARVAVDIGVDYLLGGTHAEEVLEIIAGTDIVYCPFPGRIVGHPSLLRGTIDEIAASAARLAGTRGVRGLDLLAYRFDGDVPALVRAVLDAVEVPVIAAGSVDSDQRIRELDALGVWGYTIGGAIFEDRFPGGTGVRAQLEHVLEVTRPRDVVAG
jgi:hypothetical protein